MTVNDAWWDYIRRIGDDIGVKEFDVEVGPGDLEALIADTLDDAKLDDLIGHMGRAFKPEMTRRSGFTSELFPMLPYMSLSTVEDFHTYGERIRIIDAALPAEEIGRRLARRAGEASPLWTWMAAYHPLCGREVAIQLETTKQDEHIEDIRTIVDFWRRLTLAQRGDGTLDNKDAGFTDRYLPVEETDWLLAQARPLDEASGKILRRLNATVSGFSFLSFTDSRVGIYDSGPYPAGDGRVAIVRDYLCLGESVFAYPWMQGLDAPYTGLTLVLRFDPDSFDDFEINDWGTTFTEPDQFMHLLTDAAVIGNRVDGSREVLSLEAQEEVTDTIAKLHLELYQRFASMSREERIFAATTMYSWGLKPFADLAGVTDRIDWSVSEKTRALYPDPLGDDDAAAAAFGTPIVARPGLSSFLPTDPARN